MRIVREVGPAKLLASEQARIRSTADSLLFCADIVADLSARTALSDFDALCEHLVRSGRWTAGAAARLADEIWRCGPGVDVPLRAAA
jgi:hypothetical protein